MPHTVLPRPGVHLELCDNFCEARHELEITTPLPDEMGFPDSSAGKESACNAGDTEDVGLDPWVGKIPWRRKWQPTPVSWSEKSHGQRSQAGYSPQGLKKLDTIE